jgi:chromosome condensin MukBEF MukE localization factor
VGEQQTSQVSLRKEIASKQRFHLFVLLKRRHQSPSGVVDQQIDLAEQFNHSIEMPKSIGLICDVERSDQDVRLVELIFRFGCLDRRNRIELEGERKEVTIRDAYRCSSA